ncbi:MAG: DUF72 domain-containing protein [Polyangiaceae bacterium]
MSKRARVSLPAADPARLERASLLAEDAPLPARVGHVEFGTAGWTDRTLIESGSFYPKRASSPEARLRHYAAHFPFVEVDATYYSLLPPELSARWLSITPPEFGFNVKAFPALTGHPIDVRRLPSDLRQAFVAAGFEARTYAERLPAELRREVVRRFSAFLEPLQGAGRLRAVLLQFPPWFTATRGNVRRLSALRAEHAELPLAVEFRHPSWLEESRRARVFETLRAENLSYVSVDEVGMPLLAESTTQSLALARFHGKNQSTWSKKGASVQERFDYLYDPAELGAWVEPIRRLADRAERVQVIFNNCVRNYAVLGAKDLAVLLTAPRATP